MAIGCFVGVLVLLLAIAVGYSRRADAVAMRAHRACPASAFDLAGLRVRPLRERQSLVSVDDVWVDPNCPPPPLPSALRPIIGEAVSRIRRARERGASVMLLYGAHLLRNGAAPVISQLLSRGWITHLATNGAGAIHDWEFAWLGRSTENVRENVAAGTFGAWDETGRSLMLALLAAGIDGRGYGAAVGRLVCDDGVTLPSTASLEAALQVSPADPLAPARAELLAAMRTHEVAAGRHVYACARKSASLLARAYQLGVPATVHPGIGYDIVSNHPLFNGAAVGRAAQRDFAIFSGAVDRLDGGVVLNVGSAVMGPQVFEKSLSCVNNLRIGKGLPTVEAPAFFVVDLQLGGNWDWAAGEPPRSHPAYYLRFCKSFSRMGGPMRYLECDNVLFVRHLAWSLLGGVDNNREP